MLSPAPALRVHSLRRIAALMPHPDDEIFVTGLLATAARAGAALHIITATRGERGPAPPGCTPDELASIRTRELEAACAALGAPAPTWLDLPDGGLGDLPPARLASAAAAALAPIAPDTIVSYGDDGGYGHRDHVALAAAAIAAAAALDPAPRVLAAAFPRGLLSPICRRLRRVSPSPIDPRITPERLGTERDRVDLVIDVEPVVAIKRAVTAAHRSQLPGGDPDEFLAPGLLEALSREEWYTLAFDGGAT